MPRPSRAFCRNGSVCARRAAGSNTATSSPAQVRGLMPVYFKSLKSDLVNWRLHAARRGLGSELELTPEDRRMDKGRHPQVVRTWAIGRAKEILRRAAAAKPAGKPPRRTRVAADAPRGER